MTAITAEPFRLTRAEAEHLRDVAQLEYEATPHANPLVGRERYRAAIAIINELEGRDRG